MVVSNIFNRSLYPFRYWLCTATLFMPCIDIPEIVGGAQTAQSLWLISLIGLILIITTLEKHNSNKFTFSIIDWLVLLYLSISIYELTVHGADLSSKSLLDKIALLIFYFSSKSQWKGTINSSTCFLTSLLVLTGCQVLIGTLQYKQIISSTHSIFSLTGFFNNPGPYCILLSALTSVCFSIVLFENRMLLRLLSLAVFIAGCILISIAFSRAAITSLLLIGTILLELKFRFSQHIKNSTKYVRILILLLSIGVISWTGTYLYNSKIASADGRILIWKITSELIKNNPLGVGSQKLPGTLISHQAEYFKKNPGMIRTEGNLADSITYTFNDLMQITAEKGLFGLLIFISLLYFLLKNSITLLINQYESPSINGIRASVVIFLAIIISGLFSYPLTQLPIQVIFFSAVAFVSHHAKKTEVAQLKRLPFYFWYLSKMSIGLYFIHFSFTAYNAYHKWYLIKSFGYEENEFTELESFQNILKHDAEYLLIKGTHFLWAGQYEKALLQFEIARKVSSDPQVYYLIAEAYSGLGKYSNAEIQYLTICKAIPHLLRPHYLLAKLYYRTKQEKKWLKLAKEVMNFKPKVASVQTKNMQIEITSLYLNSLSFSSRK